MFCKDLAQEEEEEEEEEDGYNSDDDHKKHYIDKVFSRPLLRADCRVSRGR